MKCFPFEPNDTLEIRLLVILNRFAILFAVLFLSMAASLVYGQGQQPTEEQRAVQQAVAEERSAHLSSLSDRAVQLRAEIAVLRGQIAKLEAAAKDCKPGEKK